MRTYIRLFDLVVWVSEWVSEWVVNGWMDGWMDSVSSVSLFIFRGLSALLVPTVAPIAYSLDWLVGRLIDWLIDLLIHWLTDWLGIFCPLCTPRWLSALLVVTVVEVGSSAHTWRQERTPPTRCVPPNPCFPTRQVSVHSSPEPPLDCWDYRYTVPATKKYSGTNPQSTGTIFLFKKVSFINVFFFRMCRRHWRLI